MDFMNTNKFIRSIQNKVIAHQRLILPHSHLTLINALPTVLLLHLYKAGDILLLVYTQDIQQQH